MDDWLSAFRCFCVFSDTLQMIIEIVLLLQALLKISQWISHVEFFITSISNILILFITMMQGVKYFLIDNADFCLSSYVYEFTLHVDQNLMLFKMTNWSVS